MSIFEGLNRVLDQARSGNASEQDLQAAYDHVSQNTPPQEVQAGLAEAFRSEQTPAFGQMVANLFGRSDPNQKAGLLNMLLPKLQPTERSQALGETGSAAGAASGHVTPVEAQRIEPRQVESMASNVERKDPTIVDQAASFFTQHPGLVKGLGAAALAVLLSRATQRRR
jgi:hypothetical protein